MVLVNRGKTPYDRAATLVVWTGIGEVIPPAVERAKRALGGAIKRALSTGVLCWSVSSCGAVS